MTILLMVIMMIMMTINIHLELFFKHFEWMRLLIGHIYALQAVDVPDGHEVDEDVDENGDEDVMEMMVW